MTAYLEVHASFKENSRMIVHEQKQILEQIIKNTKGCTLGY